MKKGSKAGKQPIRAVFATVASVDTLEKSQLTGLQTYACVDCNQSFATNPITANVDGVESSVDPFCPHCGSDEAELVGAPNDKVEDLSTEAHVATLTCSGCKTNLVMSAEAASDKGFNEVIACPVCATITSFTAGEDCEEDEELPEVVSTEAAEETTDVNPEDAVPEEETASDDEDDGEEEEEEDDSEEASTTEASDDEDDEDEDESEEASTEETAADFIKDENGSNEEVPAGPALDTPGAGDLEGAGGDDEEGTSRSEIPVLSFVDQSAAPLFFRLGSSVFASVAGLTVASIDKADIATARHDLFDSANYLKALASSASQIGLKQTIADYGMKSLTINVEASVADAVSDSRVTAAAQAQIAEHTEHLASELQSCLSIAAVGLGKGFFAGKGYTNPIRTALAAELKTAGVRKPELLLDRAFANTNDSYNASLMQVAFDLLSRPVDSRNAIGEAIEAMPYASGFVEASDDEDDDSDDESTAHVASELRLSTPFAPGGRTATTASVEDMKVNRSDSPARATVASVLAKNGGSLFSTKKH